MSPLLFLHFGIQLTDDLWRQAFVFLTYWATRSGTSPSSAELSGPEKVFKDVLSIRVFQKLRTLQRECTRSSRSLSLCLGLSSWS